MLAITLATWGEREEWRTGRKEGYGKAQLSQQIDATVHHHPSFWWWIHHVGQVNLQTSDRIPLFPLRTFH
jgi:hypothetical protein